MTITRSKYQSHFRTFSTIGRKFTPASDERVFETAPSFRTLWNTDLFYPILAFCRFVILFFKKRFWSMKDWYLDLYHFDAQMAKFT